MPRETNSAVATNPGVGDVSQGNRVTLFRTGDEAYAAAYEAIRQARRRVWLETYIFAPDEVGRVALEILAEAARRGCDVVLLFDRLGSPELKAHHLEPLRAAGARVYAYNPIFPGRRLGRRVASFLHRDHRKILIVDDAGFCGGHNVSTEYGGPGPERFYDLTVKLDGPCVRDLAGVFATSVHRAGGEPLAFEESPPPGGDVQVQVLELDARHEERDLDRAIATALHNAREHCCVVTPYFIPPPWFRRSLLQAARRGVDVRIITAGISDVPLARTAGRHVYGLFLEAGVRIFEMIHPTLHAKFITTDGHYSIVGSYNVDVYGGKHNLEVGVGVFDPALARRLEQEFDTCCGRSHEWTLAEWKRRGPLARLGQWAVFKLLHI